MARTQRRRQSSAIGSPGSSSSGIASTSGQAMRGDERVTPRWSPQGCDACVAALERDCDALELATVCCKRRPPMGRSTGQRLAGGIRPAGRSLSAGRGVRRAASRFPRAARRGAPAETWLATVCCKRCPAPRGARAGSGAGLRAVGRAARAVVGGRYGRGGRPRGGRDAVGRGRRPRAWRGGDMRCGGWAATGRATRGGAGKAAKGRGGEAV